MDVLGDRYCNTESYIYEFKTKMKMLYAKVFCLLYTLILIISARLTEQLESEQFEHFNSEFDFAERLKNKNNILKYVTKSEAPFCPGRHICTTGDATNILDGVKTSPEMVEIGKKMIQMLDMINNAGPYSNNNSKSCNEEGSCTSKLYQDAAKNSQALVYQISPGVLGHLDGGCGFGKENVNTAYNEISQAFDKKHATAAYNELSKAYDQNHATMAYNEISQASDQKFHVVPAGTSNRQGRSNKKKSKKRGGQLSALHVNRNFVAFPYYRSTITSTVADLDMNESENNNVEILADLDMTESVDNNAEIYNVLFEMYVLVVMSLTRYSLLVITNLLSELNETSYQCKKDQSGG